MPEDAVSAVQDLLHIIIYGNESSKGIVKEYFTNICIIYSYLYIVIHKKCKQKIVRSYVCFYHEIEQFDVHVFITENCENFLLSPKCSFFFRRRRVSVIYFCASNSFKMADSLTPPVRPS